MKAKRRALEAAPAAPLGDPQMEMLIAKRPRRAIDYAIDRLRENDIDSERALRDLARAIYATRGLEESSNAPVFADLFRSRLSKGDRRFVAACLIRALAANRDCIPEETMRRDVAPLIEDVVPERVFQVMGLQQDSDRPSRLVELPHIEAKAVGRLERLVATAGDVDDFPAFRQELMRALQDPTIAAVVLPFFPEDVPAAFNRLARSVGSAAELETPAHFARHKEAQSRAREFKDIASAHDTAYSERFLVRLADQLNGGLQAAFEASPLSKPAQLALLGSDKKYPLHREAEELRLSLDVNNRGDGPAFEVVLTLDTSAAVAPLATSDLILGNIPAEGRRIGVPAVVLEASIGTALSYMLVWRNADASEGLHTGDFVIAAQQANIDWERLAVENPYPSKAISDPDQLAGRRGLLQQLEAIATGPEVGSTRISGQKRVGKSSLVRSLQAKLTRMSAQPLLVAYVDVNRLGVEDDRPKEAVATTMRTISREILKTSPRLDGLEIPDYSESLQAFVEFLDDIRRLEPEKSILVIVDEFDELPNEAFERGGPGDPMFRAFKSLSSEGECGFFLVGGEKLELALSRQGDRLNAFREIHVDYLGENDVDDFRELVTRPVAGYLEFDSDAVEELQRRTGGHPFFALQICREILDKARELRDAHVTLHEVRDAYAAALQSAPASTFAHIWFDHIFDDREAVAVIADRRVRLLLGWASCIRRGTTPTEEKLIEAAVEYELPRATAREELRSLVNRKILSVEAGAYHATSRFFEDWLREFGSEKIRAEQPELDSLKRYAGKEDERRIRAQEIVDLTTIWPQFRSATISPEEVRAWLDQFGDSANQRLALKILQNIDFYPARRLKDGFVDLHRHARRGTREDITARQARGQRKRRDFVVTYIEPDGKSAQTMAQHYADANNISRECISGIERASVLVEKFSAQRLVIVDDFVGTGRTACRRLKEHRAAVSKATELTGRPAALATICGFESGIVAVQGVIDALELPIEIAVAFELDRASSCFDEASSVFVDSEERLVARRLVDELARSMGSDEPLGTGDLQALVVFEHNCPNNSLPVLWKTSDGMPWNPLFPRITTV
jgi:hypothetical protein